MLLEPGSISNEVDLERLVSSLARPGSPCLLGVGGDELTDGVGKHVLGLLDRSSACVRTGELEDPGVDPAILARLEDRRKSEPVDRSGAHALIVETQSEPRQ